ncbi:hypothetical protein NEDG_01050 [Nematocida displodere]|uniref:Bacteriophage/plasmid primase P4 C-terminal domain-containing protein n=1 Tax=Nematocida displodere TaxID=1805483 RepID=A0A177EBN2_9MICR|nr:hypothetical protein NEDG_01050 [Nematocida displodere]
MKREDAERTAARGGVAYVKDAFGQHEWVATYTQLMGQITWSVLNGRTARFFEYVPSCKPISIFFNIDTKRLCKENPVSREKHAYKECGLLIQKIAQVVKNIFPDYQHTPIVLIPQNGTHPPGPPSSGTLMLTLIIRMHDKKGEPVYLSSLGEMKRIYHFLNEKHPTDAVCPSAYNPKGGLVRAVFTARPGQNEGLGQNTDMMPGSVFQPEINTFVGYVPEGNTNIVDAPSFSQAKVLPLKTPQPGGGGAEWIISQELETENMLISAGASVYGLEIPMKPIQLIQADRYTLANSEYLSEAYPKDVCSDLLSLDAQMQLFDSTERQKKAPRCTIEDQICFSPLGKSITAVRPIELDNALDTLNMAPKECWETHSIFEKPPEPAQAAAPSSSKKKAPRTTAVRTKSTAKAQRLQNTDSAIGAILKHPTLIRDIAVRIIGHLKLKCKAKEMAEHVHGWLGTLDPQSTSRIFACTPHGRSLICSRGKYYYMKKENVWKVVAIEEVRCTVFETMCSIAHRVQKYLKAEKLDEKVRGYLGKALATLGSINEANRITTICCELLRKDAIEHLLDSDWSLLPFSNGVYDLQAKKFSEYSEDNYVTECIPYKYNQHAKCRALDSFLHEVMPNPEYLDYFLWTCSTFLNADVPNSSVIFFLGHNEDGKKLLQLLLQATLEPLVRSLTSKIFSRRSITTSKAPVDICRLKNTRCGIVSDADELLTVTAATKMLAYGDYHRLIDGPIEVNTKFVVMCKSLPYFTKTAPSLWDSISILALGPFSGDTYRYRDKHKNHRLRSMIEKDPTWRQAFMNKLLQYKNTFPYPPPVPEYIRGLKDIRKNITKYFGSFMKKNIVEDVDSVLKVGEIIQAFFQNDISPRSRSIAYKTMHVQATRFCEETFPRTAEHGLFRVQNKTVRGWKGVRLLKND